jgi:hypothetical protein
MRTTVTLDSDTEALVRSLMQQRGVSFKRALNDAIRAGVQPVPRAHASATRVRGMGVPLIDLDRALSVAAALDDGELVRRMQVGK